MISLGMGLGLHGGSSLVGNGESVADPLAGIPALLDLRTHKGDKVPFGIAAEGAPNPVWTGVVGSGTQVVVGSQPLTGLAGDGTPFLSFDGVDDSLVVGQLGVHIRYTVLMRSKTALWNNYWGPIDQVTPSVNDNRWGFFNIGTNEWNPTLGGLPNSVRLNGVDLSGGYPVPAPDEWNVLTVDTVTALADLIRAIMQLESTYFGGVEVIAFFVYDGDPTVDTIEIVEAYQQTLKPVELFAMAGSEEDFSGSEDQFAGGNILS